MAGEDCCFATHDSVLSVVACADCFTSSKGQGRRQSAKFSPRTSPRSSRATSRQSSVGQESQPPRQAAPTPQQPAAPSAPDAPKARSAVIDMAQVEAQLRNQQDELHRALEAHKRRREERLQQMMLQPASSCAAPPPPIPVDAEVVSPSAASDLAAAELGAAGPTTGPVPVVQDGVAAT